MHRVMLWFRRAGTFAAVVLLLWAGWRAHVQPLSDDRVLLTQPGPRADSIDDIDRRFRAVSLWLPARGVVGYLTPVWGEAYGGFFVAEYALAPRIVVPSTDAEFVIVPPEAVPHGDSTVVGSASSDARLEGFLLYRVVDEGVRIFRRVR